MTRNRRAGRSILVACLLVFPGLASCSLSIKDNKKEAVLDEKQKNYVRDTLVAMTVETELISFSEEDCSNCEQAETIYSEIAEVAPKVIHRSLKSGENDEEIKRYGIDRLPAVVMKKEKDVGIRYYGLPVGHEFEPFIDTIKNLSIGYPEISPATAHALAALRVPINIKIFVTPS